jgi:two-component system cell cycle sensor histidine kinase/response regulator CckA
VLDEQFRVEWANAAYREFAPGKSLIGFTWDEIWGETGQRFEGICRSVLETGIPHVVTDEGNPIRRGPDEPIAMAYFSWSLHRVKLPGRTHWNLLGTAQETTARVRATLAAQEGERAYRELFQCNPHPMWVYDKRTLAFLEVNDAAVAQYGFTREEFQRMTIADIRPPEDVVAMLSSARTEIDAVISPTRLWRHRTKDGVLIDVEITSHSIQYRGHDARLVLAHNVTKRVLAEAQLLESEALNRITVEHAAVGIAHVTPDGRFAKVNAKLCEILGYREAELLALTFQEITHRDDLGVDVEQLQQVLDGQRTHYTLEKRYVRKDGTVVPARLTASLVRSEDGLPARFISIVEDITPRVAAEAERERLQAQLVQSQKLESVGRLAGGVAHDFNNMLNVILGYTEMALIDVDPDSALAADLREVADAAHRSAGITAQLLAFARKQPVLPRRMQLNSAVEWSLKMLRRLLGEELTLTWLPGQEIWPIMMDPVQLDQVLANLVANARDAIDGPGTVTLQTRNRELAADAAALLGIPAGQYVELSVHDDGPGIPPEVLPHVFEPFFTTKDVGRGTGLGLATVFGIVTQNHGHIRAHSPPGEGATMTLLFPRAEEEGPSAEERRESGSLPRGHETVLVVEDEPALLRLASGMLASLGYRVLSADLPSVAIRLAFDSTEPIDLVLSDVVMPEQRGPVLARTILRRWPSARVLFMSGYPGPLGERKVDGIEASEILAKPFTITTLAQRVRAVLDAPS